MPAAGGVERRHTHQTMYAGFRLQEAIGVIAGDHDRCTFQTSFVAVQIVQQFCLEVVAFCPAVVHTVEHLCPVLCLSAACSGVECQNGVGTVILAGQQRSQFQGFQFLDELVRFLVEFRVGFLLALLHGEFDQGENVVQRFFHFLILFNAVFQRLDFLQYLLGIFQIAVEIRICHLLLQCIITSLCLFNAQYLVQFFQVLAVITHRDTQFI